MALLFVGQNDTVYFFLVNLKVREQIQNMNPLENILDPTNQPSNSNPTTAFYPQSENFPKICYFRECATQLQVGFSPMLYSTTFASYGPKT